MLVMFIPIVILILVVPRLALLSACHYCKHYSLFSFSLLLVVVVFLLVLVFFFFIISIVVSNRFFRCVLFVFFLHLLRTIIIVGVTLLHCHY